MSKQLNFAQQMDEVLKTLGPQRPKLLLHACCGPCSSAVLEKLCDNPLRTRLDELLHKGRDAFEAFNAAPSVKALVPLRSAFAALYQEWRALDDSAQSDEQRAQTAQTLADLEALNRKAHDACRFSYSTLEELSILQTA